MTSGRVGRALWVALVVVVFALAAALDGWRINRCVDAGCSWWWCLGKNAWCWR